MVQGLQVWDSKGNILLDESTQTATILGQAYLKQNKFQDSITVTDPRLGLGKPFYFCVGVAVNTLSNFEIISNTSFTANLTNYEWKSSWSGVIKTDAIVFYGVY